MEGLLTKAVSRPPSLISRSGKRAADSTAIALLPPGGLYDVAPDAQVPEERWKPFERDATEAGLP